MLLLPGGPSPPLASQVPESQTDGLLVLAEYIEDCEFVSLNLRVLHLLSDMGAHTRDVSGWHFAASGLGTGIPY